MNLVVLSGWLGSDPEKKELQNTTLATFPLSIIGERKKVGDEYEKVTLWLTVSFFGTQAENAVKILSKGDMVEVTGKLTKSVWEDDDGTMKSKVGVKGIHWQILPRGKETEVAEVSEEDVGF